MQTQVALGADIIMAFDDCPPAQQTPVHARAFAAANETRTKAVRKIQTDMDDGDYRQRVKAACERTLRWLDRCQAEFAQLGGLDNQALFPIVQGGTDLELRQWHVEQTIQRDAPGYAIGGVAVGETSAQIARVVEFTAPLLPQERPRYLMGVGYERDIVAAVRAGVDMFDCVLPTRNARNAQAFTPNGPIKLRNACHALDEMPVDETCDCACCGAGYSRAYLHHMFKANEMLGGILLTLHNLRHFQRLMLDIRATIRDNTWSEFYRQWPVALPLTV